MSPLECDVLQLIAPLNLEHNRLSWLQGLKQRPKLLTLPFLSCLLKATGEVKKQQIETAASRRNPGCNGCLETLL